MFYYLLDKLVCPKTLKNLKCQVFEFEDLKGVNPCIEKCKDFCGYKGIDVSNVSIEDCNKCRLIRIINGKLSSQDDQYEYPIINGVPRLLTGNNINRIYVDYNEFFNKYESKFNKKFKSDENGKSEFEQAQLNTSESFGNEWEKFNNIIPSYEKLFNEYFKAVDLKTLKGKSVLDAGCGMGRWAYYVGQNGADIYAVDFSKSVDEANRNLKDYSNAHVIQADIYNLPFKSDTFDFAYSLGVLHHLPEPLEGFKQVSSKVKKGGGLLVYLYYALDNKPYLWRLILSIVTIFRKITTRMPKVVLYPVCFCMSCIFQVLFVIPSKILQKLGLLKLIKYIPLNDYRKRPFRMLYNDTIDRFSAPIENRYSRVQIREWFKSVGISECIIPEQRPYWCAYGIKPNK